MNVRGLDRILGESTAVIAEIGIAAFAIMRHDLIIGAVAVGFGLVLAGILGLRDKSLNQ